MRRPHEVSPRYRRTGYCRQCVERYKRRKNLRSVVVLVLMSGCSFNTIRDPVSLLLRKTNQCAMARVFLATILILGVSFLGTVAQGPAPIPSPPAPPGQLGTYYGHLESELKTKKNKDIEGSIHLFVFQSGSDFNVQYVITLQGLSSPNPPNNATITNGENGPIVLDFSNANWTDFTGQPGSKNEGESRKGSSFAATGVWLNAKGVMAPGGRSVADVATAIVGDPESYYGHVGTVNDGEATGEFELEE
eukprot:TRINITY_DN32554_c0_g1_i1.p1 TRINITY_DN32554_c0_g1~~TRINITY_DN32554_c0_g1_i1.p1  ORF type:complete len:248 (-),score=13.40 TRINITY_DN32554_c0_g1_i1:91-834(-)